MERAKTPLNAIEFEVAANETRALILDTRDGVSFANAFIPNSINIGIDGNFAQWVGEMIPDVTQEILLVAEPGRLEESLIRLSRVGYDNVIGYLKGGFQTWLDAGKETDNFKRITAQEFETMYKEDKKVIFDVRKKSEFDAEHVVDAINVPLNQINQHLAEFPKDKSFVIYCAGGYRSMVAASILKQRGWNDFVDVIGGFGAISKQDVPKTEYVCPTTLL